MIGKMLEDVLVLGKEVEGTLFFKRILATIPLSQRSVLGSMKNKHTSSYRFLERNSHVALDVGAMFLKTFSL